MSKGARFLSHPGRPGGFGALLDEYARAAEDFCTTVERVTPSEFLDARESGDPDTLSIQTICLHVLRASHGYADDLRKLGRLDCRENPFREPSLLPAPEAVRPRLGEALRYTEEAIEPLLHATAEEVLKAKFQTRWGATYDPEMLLEHAIVHLLRHRRQVERWNEASPQSLH